MLPDFTCAIAIRNLWSICFGVNILIWLRLETLWSETTATQATRAKSEGHKANICRSSLPYCCLSTIFSTISTILFGFSFSGSFFISIYLSNSINASLICFTISSFLIWLLLYSLWSWFNNIFKYLMIYIFFIIFSFINIFFIFAYLYIFCV